MNSNDFIQLTDQELRDFSLFVKSRYGIDLSKKKQLIESRMQKVFTERKIKNFTDYFNLIKKSDQNEVTVMLNKLTTNHTYFMREAKHYEFMKEFIMPQWEKNNRDRNLRIWSAGCSTGEEAYTTVMVLKDYFAFQNWDYRLLATDISAKALESAQKAVYHKDALSGIPPSWARKYFVRNDDNYFALSDDIRKEVIFRRLNLMEPFSFAKPFDLIFCRNVMIYFDQPTKNMLTKKFYDVLKPGGFLFIGHSETIQHGIAEFNYIKPSIYQKG
ncbi:MAG: protein-glutamate O-methyltransferase CheR [Bacillota bacterium]|nr:protein-glutamate O-methyltransferase CheR [Bacillota bacterium]